MSDSVLSRLGRLRRRLRAVEEPGTRRCRLALSLPVTVLLGAAYGVLATDRMTLGLLPLVALGIVGTTAVVVLAGELEALTRLLLGPERAGRWKHLVTYGWDIVTGGALGQVGALLLDAGTVAGVGVGSALGFTFAFVTSELFCGGTAEGMVALLTGSADGGSRRPDYSRADALAARGAHEAALELYREHCGPGAPRVEPYRRIARILVRDMDRPEDAVGWLRRAVEEVRPPAEVRKVLVREILDLCEHRLDEPLRAAPDLARFAADAGENDAGTWARDLLGELKARERRRRRGSPDVEGSR